MTAHQGGLEDALVRVRSFEKGRGWPMAEGAAKQGGLGLAGDRRWPAPLHGPRPPGGELTQDSAPEPPGDSRAGGSASIMYGEGSSNAGNGPFRAVLHLRHGIPVG